jgi:hypothetical protein
VALGLLVSSKSPLNTFSIKGCVRVVFVLVLLLLFLSLLLLLLLPVSLFLSLFLILLRIRTLRFEAQSIQVIHSH